MPRILSAQLWRKRGAPRLARRLLGCVLVRRWPDGREERSRIVEVEAYDGERDLACHARSGRTGRTETLYAPGGVWYVYLCYGIHEMLNLVVGPKDWPAAILIRSVAEAGGPGRLTSALGIGRELNGRPASPASGLWIEDRSAPPRPGAVRAGPRVGVGYAGPLWSRKPWRFVLAEPDLKRPAGGTAPRSRSRRRHT